MKKLLRFRLNWIFQGPNSPFLHAADAGYFADAGLDCVFQEGQSSSLVGAAIAAGEADFGFGDVPAALERNLAGLDDSIACLMPVFQRSPACIAFRSDRPVVALDQLENSSIAGPPHDTAGRMLPLLMEQSGLAGLRYSYRDVSPQQRDEGLLDGSLRAVTGFDATILFSLQARGVSADKVGFLYFADLGMDIYSASVLCSQSIAGNRELCGQLRRIFATAWNDCKSNPELGVDAVCRRLPDANRTLVRRHLEWVLTHQVFPEGAGAFGSLRTGKAERSLEIARSLAGAPEKPFDSSIFFLRDLDDTPAL